MRLPKLYLRLFLPFIVLVVTSVLCFIFLPADLNNFNGSLIATFLGVGTAISFAEALRKFDVHKRRKKTTGLLKLITIPYLENQCSNFKENSKLYKDMGDLEHVRAFLLLVRNYHRLDAGFDKSWFQLIYSVDFIETVENDAHINAIGHAISDILVFTKTLTSHSLNASRLLDLMERLEGEKTLDGNDVINFVAQARKIRDDLDDNVEKLVESKDELNRELETLFAKNGMFYEEKDR